MAADAVTLRVPPHSVESEQSVLGALLVDNTAWDVVGDLLVEQDFYRYEHRQLWTAIASLVLINRPADPITVHERLGAAWQGEQDALVYLTALAQAVPSARNARRYAEIVRERAMRRKLILIADSMATAAYADAAGGPGEQVQRIVDEAVAELLGVARAGDAGREPRRIADLLPAFVDAVDDRASGETDAMATGLRALDDLLDGGLRRGELVGIGARPSMGKSAMALTIARNMAQKYVVAVLSLEDSERQLVTRHVAAAGRVPMHQIRRPDKAPDTMWDGLLTGIEALKPLRLYIDDQPGLTYADVRRKAAQVKRAAGGALDVLVVDYLQLMEYEGDNRNQALGRIANSLKRLAKDMGIAIIVLSQLSREADKRPGVPQLADLRDSGDIEAALDIAVLLHRQFRRKPTEENKHHADAHVAKQKSGPTDTISLWFDGATQRFGDWDGPRPGGGA